jgi:hypothetical protein
MVKIDWTNQYDELDSEEIKEEYKKYSSQGWEYEPSDELFLTSDYVTNSKGDSFNTSDIEKILSGKLIFGDEKQIEAIEAAEFLKVAWAHFPPFEIALMKKLRLSENHVNVIYL